jgi:hypothetical protein
MTIVVANTELANTWDYLRTRVNELAYASTNYNVTTDSNTAVGNAAITGTFTSNTVITNTLTSLDFNANNILANSLTLNTNLTIGSTTLNNSTLSVTTVNALSINIGTSYYNESNLVIGNTTVNQNFIKTGNSVINSTSIINGNSAIYPNYYSAGISTTNTVINSTSVVISNPSSSLSLTAPTAVQTSSGTHFLNANGQWATIAQTAIPYTPISNGQVNISSGPGIFTLDTFLANVYSGAEYLIQVSDTASNNYYITKLLCTHDNGFAFMTDYGGVSSNNIVTSFSTTWINNTHSLLVTTSVPSVTIKYVRTII